MAVEIVESCMVPPGDETPKHRLWLSVFDLVQGRIHSPVISLYRPCLGSSAAFSPDILKAALSQALVPFYPIAGRLGWGSSGRPEIHCTGDGVLFFTARTDTTLDELSEELRQMLVPSAAEAGDHAGVLAMFQVTFFKCGGVCLGTAIHHTACEGRAASNFMKMWAATARGDSEAIASLQPCLDRTLLRGRSPLAVRFQHPEYPRRGSVPSTTTTKAPFNTAVFPISKNQVDALKAAAAGGGGASAGKKVSTYSAVVAHVWQCSCIAKGISGTAASRVYGVGCLRSRMCPPLPGVYFGNAVALTSTTVTKVKDIVSSPLDAVTDKVSAAIAGMRSDEYVQSLADYLELAMNDTPGLQHLGQWAVPDTDLFVVSWIGLPLIDVDFGWGRPSFVGRAMLNQSNLLYLVPSPDGDGQLNVTVTMEPQALSRFKELFYEGLEHYSVVSQKHFAQDAHVVIHAKL